MACRPADQHYNKVGQVLEGQCDAKTQWFGSKQVSRGKDLHGLLVGESLLSNPEIAAKTQSKQEWGGHQTGCGVYAHMLFITYINIFMITITYINTFMITMISL